MELSPLHYERMVTYKGVGCQEKNEKNANFHTDIKGFADSQRFNRVKIPAMVSKVNIGKGVSPFPGRIYPVCQKKGRKSWSIQVFRSSFYRHFWTPGFVD